MATTMAFVTKSYGPDFERCALLRRSVAMFAPTVPHVIVVDRAEVAMFARLQDNRTTIVATEELLPVWMRRLDLRRVGLRPNVWFQARGRPVRGWVMQQLIKLAVANALSEDVLVHMDSDVVLLRPFETSSVVDAEGRVRLFALPDAVGEDLPSHVAWHRSAERLLGISPTALPATDYITTIVPWKRMNAVALLSHIEAHNGGHWLQAVAATKHLSEYILYGRFVTDVLGESAGQYVTSSSLSHDYWTRTALTERELEAFLDDMGPEQIGVNLTAKAGMDPADYGPTIERRWRASHAGTEPATEPTGTLGTRP